MKVKAAKKLKGHTKNLRGAFEHASNSSGNFARKGYSKVKKIGKTPNKKRST